VRRHLSRTDSLHSLHYLLTCTCKTAQDARQFLCWRFFRSCTDRMAQVTRKTAQDARHFLFWRFFGPVPTARLIWPL